MFTISNKTYASAGNLLKKNGWVGFSCKTSDNIIEILINDDDIKIKDGMFVWNAGKLQIPVIPNEHMVNIKKDWSIKSFQQMIRLRWS